LSLVRDYFNSLLEVNSEEEAREVMLSDPAVADGVMTATLYPYSVALMR
jgi:hypothetical protein